MWYVYILKCRDGYYHGCTDDLKERIVHHAKRYVPATKERRPLELFSYIAFREKIQSICV
ncbi:MAG TPA: GIY-YIG nuclease family protein [Candidatus Paceibacterota bacterium]